MGLLGFLLGAMFALSVWFMVCNRQTYCERSAVLRRIDPVRPDGREALYAFVKVPYDKHLWARFTFRDPWSLYPPQFHRWLRGKNPKGGTP